jgi:hypothetical protein
MPKLIPVGAMRGNSGFLRRQEPISPAIERLHEDPCLRRDPVKRSAYRSRKAM